MDMKMIADSLVADMGEEREEAPEEVDEGQMVAAEEAMEALKSNDVSAFARALRSFLAMA